LNEGTLFVVATPIGNLDDLSPRAREVLGAADLIAAEDTRVTGRLLSHFGIKSRQTDHNEASVVARLIGELLDGKSIALVSDAGTPSISDPGFRLLREAHQAGITVSPLPGACAFVAALSASGLPTDRFVFEGFLPAKKAARAKRLQDLGNETRTLIFYESVHRIAATIQDLIDCFGAGRRAFIGRELTKLYEQCVGADLAGLAAMLEEGQIPRKGEFVIVLEGAAELAPANDSIDAQRLLEELVEILPGKQAVAIVARLSGQKRNVLYDKMLALRPEAAD